MTEQSTNGPTVSNTANITSGVKEKDPHRVAAGKRLATLVTRGKHQMSLRISLPLRESQNTFSNNE